MLIIQIALGIVLGFLILANLGKLIKISASLVVLGAIIIAAVIAYSYVSETYTLDTRKLINFIVAISWLVGIIVVLGIASHYLSVWLGATQEIAIGFIIFAPILAVVIYYAIESLTAEPNYVLISLGVILAPVYFFEIRRMRLDKLEEDKRKAARSAEAA